ncbi:MAG: PepSY domain-containing protein [Caulobacterales bacterium]|nr:PepSY domain-containing protein [Caulobacterales bacterium]
MKRYLILLAAAAALAAPPAASASPAMEALATAAGYQQFRARQDDGPRVSLSDVVRRLRATRQGQMLDAQATTRDGRAIYVIIWEYPGGRIGNIYVDQRTGAVLGEN